MKISVIVPIYNVEKYLAECIDSILAQTFSDWELILVNDGSPDNSDKICQEYVKRDARIRYLAQTNAGVSAARNMGLGAARGEYIFVLDSDDTIDTNFLGHAYETARKNKSDIVVLGEYFRQRMPHPAALPVMATFFKKSLLEKYPDIKYPVGIQPCEDGLFSHMLLAMTQRISLDARPQYNYRQHDEQNHTTINNATEKVLNQIPKWLDILIDFYNKYDLWDKHALHLAKFLEHEPFGFRYMEMPFNTT